MKFFGSPVFVLLLLSIAATLYLKFPSRLFLIFLFNSVVLAVVVQGTPGGQAEDWCFSYSTASPYDAGDDLDEDNKNTDRHVGEFDDEDAKNKEDVDEDDCSDIDDEYNDGSDDGYDEDDDDEDGSDDEIGWDDDDDDDDDEEVNGNLESRVEAFISMVTKGWKDEWLSDNFGGEMFFG